MTTINITQLPDLFFFCASCDALGCFGCSETDSPGRSANGIDPEAVELEGVPPAKVDARFGLVNGQKAAGPVADDAEYHPEDSHVSESDIVEDVSQLTKDEETVIHALNYDDQAIASAHMHRFQIDAHLAEDARKTGIL